MFFATTGIIFFAMNFLNGIVPQSYGKLKLAKLCDLLAIYDTIWQQVALDTYCLKHQIKRF